ncbi:tellurite resistance/C4-dicarboxylate transporter family protein [Streptomyces sp. NRRL S-813]|uniref:tellurite resistance/C4-dicarboxylate transporter family protein n=1 Tax=Streptomyces sp. NRRL S-813 TaxID=1463919 RepID=UPI0004C19966|nr:tellurite resistance/C4-dicarboxylate transporter family protein [Streptomyces sp. NRRL S-813]
MPATSPFRAWLAQRPPAAGAAVMATGILSVGLHLTGYEALSLAVLAVACVAWLALAADFVVRLLRERARWVQEAGTPGALTGIAATSVLGTRFSAMGWQHVAEAALALAVVMWPWLLVRVVRISRRPMPGSVFLCCVATEGLSVLGASVARAEATAWLAHTALVFFWLGLVLYVFALTLFDLRQVVVGRGDHWVAGGALAISALAGAKLLAASSGGPYLWNEDDRDVLHTATLALLAFDVCWCAVLLVAELARPRLGYDVCRWSTVFPLGMTAAAMLSVASALDIPQLTVVSEAVLWVAVAAWVVVAAAAVTDARAELRSTAPR